MDFLSEISNIRTHFVINILLYGEFCTLLHIHVQNISSWCIKPFHHSSAVATASATATACRNADDTITRDLFCNFNFTILVFRSIRMLNCWCVCEWCVCARARGPGVNFKWNISVEMAIISCSYQTTESRPDAIEHRFCRHEINAPRKRKFPLPRHYLSVCAAETKAAAHKTFISETMRRKTECRNAEMPKTVREMVERTKSQTEILISRFTKMNNNC